MNLIRLFDSTLVALAYGQIFIDIFNSAFGIYFILSVEFIDGGEGIADGAYIVIFLLFHVFVHTLHAHNTCFLLAVEHQGLLVQTAFYFEGTVSSTVIASTGVVAGLAPSLEHFGCTTLGVDVASSFSI